MDYDSLRFFVHLSRTLHFGRTARACHISTSGLTRAIQRLEQELDRALFERDQRRVKLTAQGASFQHFAQKALDDWNAFQQETRKDPKELSGSLSVFCSVTAGYMLFTPVLRRFGENHPGVRVHLETGYSTSALDLLFNDSADVVVSALPTRRPRNLVAKLLFQEPVVFFAPAFRCAVSRQLEKTHHDWASIPFVLPQVGRVRNSANAWFRARKIRPSIYAETPGHEGVVCLVASGFGVGVTPLLTIQASPLRSLVRILDVKGALPPVAVSACTLRRKLHSPVVRALWDIIDVEEK